MNNKLFYLLLYFLANVIIIYGESVTENCGSRVTCTLDVDGKFTITPSATVASAGFPRMGVDDKNKIKSIVIEDGVTEIQMNAFSGCGNLESITIPESVTKIGFAAFEYCSKLKSITIPNSVTSIKSWVFSHCINLKSVRFNGEKNLGNCGKYPFNETPVGKINVPYNYNGETFCGIPVNRDPIPEDDDVPAKNIDLTEVEPIFKASFYYNKYPDLRKAIGNNTKKLKKHFKQYGMKEGRRGSILFNVQYYSSNNPYTKKTFGNNYPKYYNHFLKYGMNEGRPSSEVFNVDFYREKYSDLNNAFGNDLKKYYYHFMKYGMKEGRQGCKDFNVKAYKEHYADLRKAFGSNLEKYYEHWVNFGIKEKRRAV